LFENRVHRAGPAKPGNFPELGMESPRERMLVLESSRNLLYASKKPEMYGRQ